MSHRFLLGQRVVFSPGDTDILNTSTTVGRVIRLLPKEESDYQYHVQFETDGERRRVLERQLRSAEGSTGHAGGIAASSAAS